MKRFLVTFALIIATFLLQSTVFQAIPFTNITPNLLLIMAVSFGFIHGKKSGLMVGFFCGLLVDIFYSNLFGFHALILMFVGYANGFLYKIFFDEDIKVPLILIGVSDIVYNIIYYVIQFAFRMRFDFWAYLTHVILPEAIYTVLISIIFYRIYFVINKKLVTSELEGQQSLWLRR